MKAAIINGFGDVDVLKYEDIETPTPKPAHKQDKKNENDY